MKENDAINKLKEIINKRFKHVEERSNLRFNRIDELLKELDNDLKKMDEDVRGDRKVGINIRLNRLENSKKCFWIIITAIAPVFRLFPPNGKRFPRTGSHLRRTFDMFFLGSIMPLFLDALG